MVGGGVGGGGGGGSYYGGGPKKEKVKGLCMGLSEMYLSWYNLFLQFLYSYIIEEEKNDVSMLSCGALKRSNNPYIESIVGPCFF